MHCACACAGSHGLAVVDELDRGSWMTSAVVCSDARRGQHASPTICVVLCKTRSYPVIPAGRSTGALRGLHAYSGKRVILDLIPGSNEGELARPLGPSARLPFCTGQVVSLASSSANVSRCKSTRSPSEVEVLARSTHIRDAQRGKWRSIIGRGLKAVHLQVGRYGLAPLEVARASRSPEAVSLCPWARVHRWGLAAGRLTVAVTRDAYGGLGTAVEPAAFVPEAASVRFHVATLVISRPLVSCVCASTWLGWVCVSASQSLLRDRDAVTARNRPEQR